MQALELGAWRERIAAQDASSLRLRLYQALRQAIAAGDLRPGERLPSSRQAAESLAMARNTVNGAYDLLRAEGCLEIAPGRRPRIRAAIVPDAKVGAKSEAKSEAKSGAKSGAKSEAPGGDRRGVARRDDRAGIALSGRGQGLAHDYRARARAQASGPFSPGEPDPKLFPADAWGRALRRAARRDYGARAGYRDPHGLPGLRSALADQLERHRGVRVAPHRILILPTVQSGLVLAATALADPGDLALVEDPGYAGARAAFAGAGLRLGAMPVDADGADVAAVMPETPPRLIYVTPSTQYPTGARMALHRRMALLDHARAHQAIILEDDYDSEFVWRGGEIAALQALDDEDRVIGFGTVAKSLLPGLRLAWMVVPDTLVEDLRQAQRNLGLLANLHGQAALQDFLESGEYRAHLRRITRAYGERARMLVDGLQTVLADQVQILRPDGGLQVCVPLPDAVEEAALVAALQARGFAVAGFSGYHLDHGRAGLVIGFAHAHPAGVAALCAALEEVMRTS